MPAFSAPNPWAQGSKNLGNVLFGNPEWTRKAAMLAAQQEQMGYENELLQSRNAATQADDRKTIADAMRLESANAAMTQIPQAAKAAYTDQPYIYPQDTRQHKAQEAQANLGAVLAQSGIANNMADFMRGMNMAQANPMIRQGGTDEIRRGTILSGQASAVDDNFAPDAQTLGDIFSYRKQNADSVARIRNEGDLAVRKATPPSLTQRMGDAFAALTPEAQATRVGPQPFNVPDGSIALTMPNDTRTQKVENPNNFNPATGGGKLGDPTVDLSRRVAAESKITEIIDQEINAQLGISFDKGKAVGEIEDIDPATRMQISQKVAQWVQQGVPAQQAVSAVLAEMGATKGELTDRPGLNTGDFRKWGFPVGGTNAPASMTTPSLGGLIVAPQTRISYPNAAGARVAVISPSGQRGSIPESQLQEALQKGFRQVQ